MADIKCVIFDLDDTLYNEIKYVECAFWNVAVYLSKKYSVSADEFYKKMIEMLNNNGRGRIFDDVIKCFDLQENPKSLVEVYRSTLPKLDLYEDAKKCIEILKKKQIKLGIITDGCSQVQHNKIKGLGLDEIVDCIIVTDDYTDAAKPSVIAYNLVMEKLEIKNPCNCIYVGDNPEKDFIGARKVGMHTVRIVRKEGMFMGVKEKQGYEADYTIQNLQEILTVNY
ncbi:MAG: HAD family hydrolase [Lachnospiraceae bacterium]|nr:HAD family hydrolase [Lachnospiraceae bacterium]